MAFDPTELTPAPWGVISNFQIKSGVVGADGPAVVHCFHGEGKETCEANAAFIALARNAFDAQERLKLSVVWNGKEWAVPHPEFPDIAIGAGPTSIEAVLAAKEWYVANVERPN